jgi:transcriptional regulator with XRE-family HTH domain
MTQDLKNYIGLRVKSSRAAAGLTQEQLAERVEKAVETISNLERGSVMTGIETLEQIAHEFGVPLSNFVEGFDRQRESSRERLELENKFQQFAVSLSDRDLASAIDLVEVIAKRGAT